MFISSGVSICKYYHIHRGAQLCRLCYVVTLYLHIVHIASAQQPINYQIIYNAMNMCMQSKHETLTYNGIRFLIHLEL